MPSSSRLPTVIRPERKILPAIETREQQEARPVIGLALVSHQQKVRARQQREQLTGFLLQQAWRLELGFQQAGRNRIEYPRQRQGGGQFREQRPVTHQDGVGLAGRELLGPCAAGVQ